MRVKSLVLFRFHGSPKINLEQMKWTVNLFKFHNSIEHIKHGFIKFRPNRAHNEIEEEKTQLDHMTTNIVEGLKNAERNLKFTLQSSFERTCWNSCYVHLLSRGCLMSCDWFPNKKGFESRIHYLISLAPSSPCNPLISRWTDRVTVDAVDQKKSLYLTVIWRVHWLNADLGRP